MHIADHQHLHPTKGTVFVSVLSKNRIDSIKQICPHHRNLVDNHEVNRANESQFLPAESIALIVTILSTRNLRTEWQLKEGMNCHALCIDSGNTRRSHHYHTFRHFPTQLTKESRLTCSRLTRQEQMRISISYDIPS